MVNRNQGSGTRALIDRLLGGAKPPGYAVQPRNHNAVAAAVVQGRADWGVTLDTIARTRRARLHPRAARAVRLRDAEGTRRARPRESLPHAARRTCDTRRPDASWDEPVIAVLDFPMCSSMFCIFCEIFVGHGPAPQRRS